MARISRRDFRKAEQHALNVNVRLRTRGTKPTRAEVRSVLTEIQESGRVPAGWQVAMIRWTHAKSGTGNWRKGNVKDLRDNFGDVIEYLLENMRIGVDRAKSRGDVWEIEIAMEY